VTYKICKDNSISLSVSQLFLGHGIYLLGWQQPGRTRVVKVRCLIHNWQQRPAANKTKYSQWNAWAATGM